MLVTRESIISGSVNTMDLNVTGDQLMRYASGEGFIQEIFPNLNADEREFIKSGITPIEWDSLFGEEEQL